MEKQRPSWKAELLLRRKGHSLDKFQFSKMSGTQDPQDSMSASPELRRTLSDWVRPLDRQAVLSNSGASVASKPEKTKQVSRESGGQRSNHHKNKTHKKGQHGLLKNLANFLTKTGSEEQREKGEKKKDKKSKEKCNSLQDTRHLEACVDPPETTFTKKDKERKDKKSKEKCNSLQDTRHLEACVDPPETTFTKKDKERKDKKSKEKCNSLQDTRHLEACVDPPETTFRKKDKERKDKKSKEKDVFPHGSEPLEACVDPQETTFRKKDKKSAFKRAFSFKRHGNEEAKKSTGLDAGNPETKRPTKPTFLPLCISHRPASLTASESDEDEIHEDTSTQARNLGFTGLSKQAGLPPPEEKPPPDRSSKAIDIIIQRIVAVLREEGDRWDEKIKEDPSFRVVLENLSFTSFQTLTDALVNQGENQKKPDRSRQERRYQFAIYLTNKFAGNANHAVLRFMGCRDHAVPHTFGHIPYNNEQYGASSPFHSPD
ncbi:protein BNIP5 [Gracilinanus agilis]|uniref:protein BNIP5 n=1 Tax=Gracilinanus agilis TaxID=191870 RepID=UPI001CFCD4DD|nr:protein BNIP5 [Gracilinanus agilis]